MKARPVLMIVAICLAGGPAAADNFAIGLGRLLGAEAACGLTFDVARVKALIVERMTPGDLDFSNIMSTYTWLEADNLEKMGETERAAVCETARINAENLGLLVAP